MQKTFTSYKKKTKDMSMGPERKGFWAVCRWSTLLLRISDQ